MKYKATLSKTTTDIVKSKIQSPMLVQLVLDVYMTPESYAQLLNKFYNAVFDVELREPENDPETNRQKDN